MRSVRRRDQAGARANMLELFYDLVFVFAITQVSHFLLEHLSWSGAGEALIVLMAVWWSWNYTTWATNELDPESPLVRLLLIGLMLGSLLMAIAIPSAFADKGLLFAGAYVALQVGRGAFLAFVAAEPGTIERRRAMRLVIWFLAAGAFWIAGGIAEDSTRVALWVAALAIDYAGPLVMYRIPGLERLAASTWTVGSEHFAERFGLFVIIALGESIVITGATTAGLELETKTIAAFALAFAITAAFWWLYFNSIALLSERALAESERRTLLARDVYTYLHGLLIAGIIVSAVGDELVIAHPDEELATAELFAVVGGPVLYLLSQALMRLRVTGAVSVRRTGGALACVGVGVLLASAPALTVAAALLGVLCLVLAADQVALRRRAAGRDADLLEQFRAHESGSASPPR